MHPRKKERKSSLTHENQITQIGGFSRAIEFAPAFMYSLLTQPVNLPPIPLFSTSNCSINITGTLLPLVNHQVIMFQALAFWTILSINRPTLENRTGYSGTSRHRSNAPWSTHQNRDFSWHPSWDRWSALIWSILSKQFTDRTMTAW